LIQYKDGCILIILYSLLLYKMSCEVSCEKYNKSSSLSVICESYISMQNRLIDSSILIINPLQRVTEYSPITDWNNPSLGLDSSMITQIVLGVNRELDPELDQDQKLAKNLDSTYFDNTLKYMENNMSSITYSDPDPDSDQHAESSYIDEAEYDVLQFGVLNLEIKGEELCAAPLFVMFTIDRSTSMSDQTRADGRTKMQYVAQSVSNILQIFIATQHTEIYVCIHTFDSGIEEIIYPTLVTKDNIMSLVVKINAILPRNNTNIELALIDAKETIDKYRAEYPEHRIVSINMSDGVITEGERSHAVLATYLSQEYLNIFVGYGIQHNAKLLQDLTTASQGEYRFVDKLENVGLVFGEIIHSILFPALTDVTIMVTNGLIYDWQLNQWTTSIRVPRISGNEYKKYHICTKTYNKRINGVVTESNEISGCILGKYVTTSKSNGKSNGKLTQVLINTFDAIPPLCNFDPSGNIIVDLSENLMPYMFRQNVLELLHEATVLHASSDRLRRSLSINIKHQIKRVFNQIKDYIKLHDLFTDIFLKILLDDLYITLKALDSVKYGLMFILARHSAQAKQQYYNVTNIEDLELGENSSYIGAPRPLSRGFTQDYAFTQPDAFIQPLYNDDEDSDEDNDVNCVPAPRSLTHQLSENTQSVNVTPTAKWLMTSASDDSAL
jgi:hypothetical protein